MHQRYVYGITMIKFNSSNNKYDNGFLSATGQILFLYLLSPMKTEDNYSGSW